ncbi:hypothetical protein GYMLUDRAFT_180789 [Collybiopsis luxurians FD-317 M1]|uniref:Glutaminase n=1 Tax=Collybiopsis luxurians FD-317 M1 TaxID=944289 RepID=A0A0D0BC28_9AGAR|nr:hypothetical protein GYMLUDRAFT_180789 [Collybiopsis luxurians FD-317 M1]
MSQSIQPPAIPLAVRSPYLQAYLSHTPINSSLSQYPNFWTGHLLGWAGLLIVDDAFYNWLGNHPTTSNVTVNTTTLESYQVTPTRSILNMTAGNMAVNITFLSPIEPDDLALQSFPFTYIFLEASSTDGKPHSLQVYHDITGEWISDDVTDTMKWDTTWSDSIIFHQAQRSTPEAMTEKNNMAEDGVVYYVTNAGNNVTYQIGQANPVREEFLNRSRLANTSNAASGFFQNISVDDVFNSNFPVLAFSNDLGTITSTSSPMVWGIGLVRNPDIVSTTSVKNQNQMRQPYFFTKYSNVSTAMMNFMSDASNALQRAMSFDRQVISDTIGISSNYTDLVSLASRQVMAGMEITVGTDSNGQLDQSDVLIFMKDIGNSQQTNPIDVMYAAFPAILYINSSWAGYLLEPLLQYESSQLYSNNFTAGDLGDSFPEANGNSNPLRSLAMENIGDMLIMIWAHATFSGDGSLLSSYYSTLKTWTDTLISEDPLMTDGFVTADGLDNTNMTNLAIKGIIAIRCMAEISQVVGESDDYNDYFNSASSMVTQWQTLAVSDGHLTSTYGDSGSWGLIYNLYPDKLLDLNLVDNSVSSRQDIKASTPSFGFPFDINNDSTAISHWTLFTAGTVNDSDTKDSLVSMVHAAATSNQKAFAVFPTTYSTSDGTPQGGYARYADVPFKAN